MKGEINDDIIYNFTNGIITDRFGSDRYYCRRGDTATDIRRCDCLCINYLFHCKILHTEEEMRPSWSLSFCAKTASSIMKGGVTYVSAERESKQHLETKIRMMEDAMLRTRNVYEIKKYRKELTFMRRKLQKMQYES